MVGSGADDFRGDFGNRRRHAGEFGDARSLRLQHVFGPDDNQSSGKLEVLNASTKSAAGVLGRGAVAVSAGAALLFDNADKADNGYVVDNVISGAGAVDFVGPNDAVTTLNEANKFTGGAKISSGIVDLSNNASLGSGLVTMTGGAIRAVHGAKTLANKFTLSGTIGLGSATNITGAITLAGDTTVTPSVNAGDSTLSGAISLGAFTLATGDSGPNSDGGSWAGQGLTISGAISGTGGVIKTAPANSILPGRTRIPALRRSAKARSRSAAPRRSAQAGSCSPAAAPWKPIFRER